MCKARGFSLKNRASQTLNLNSMRDAFQCWMKRDEVPELVTTKNTHLEEQVERICIHTCFSQTLWSDLQQEERFGKF